MGEPTGTPWARRCRSCGHLTVAGAHACPHCGSVEADPIPLSGRGTVYSWTTIRTPSEAFADQVPYTLAIVAMEEGLRLLARVATEGEQQIEIGDSVVFAGASPSGWLFRKQ
ncbi:MAG: OB-fold domain-containing protein [Chloroflexi bacterium]|nr:OB-fold domain-containing protein [Chloroflexota bacterium]